MLSVMMTRRVTQMRWMATIHTEKGTNHSRERMNSLMLDSMLKQGLPIQESLVDEIKEIKSDEEYCKFGPYPTLPENDGRIGAPAKMPG